MYNYLAADMSRDVDEFEFHFEASQRSAPRRPAPVVPVPMPKYPTIRNSQNSCVHVGYGFLHPAAPARPVAPAEPASSPIPVSVLRRALPRRFAELEAQRQSRPGTDGPVVMTCRPDAQGAMPVHLSLPKTAPLEPYRA